MNGGPSVASAADPDAKGAYTTENPGLPNRNENRDFGSSLGAKHRHLATLIVCSRSCKPTPNRIASILGQRSARVRCPLAGYFESIRLIYETGERCRLSRDGHSPHFTNKLFAKYALVGSWDRRATGPTKRGEKKSGPEIMK